MEQKETIAQLLKEFGVKEVYSCVAGEMLRIEGIDKAGGVPIITSYGCYDKNGKYYRDKGECMLFLDKEHTPITRSELEKRYPKKNGIKTWEDIIEQERVDNFSYVYETQNCYYYANERLHRHAIAEAKISQILAQGDYEMADYKGNGWEIYWSQEVNDFGILARGYNAVANILYFETESSAVDFLSHDSNQKFAKDYLMRE